MEPQNVPSSNMPVYGDVSKDPTGQKIALTKEEQDRRRLNGSSSTLLASGVEKDDENLSATMDKIETVFDPPKLTCMQPTLPGNGEGPTLWSCHLCNAHNLVNARCAAENSFHEHRAAVLASCYYGTLSWCTCLVPQYSKYLGFRLVPYVWTCRPVQLSALCRQLGHDVPLFSEKNISLVQEPINEDASKEEVVSSSGFDNRNPPCLSSALVESDYQLIQCSSTATTDTISDQEQDNDETSTLAGENWTDDPEEVLWEVSMSEDGDDEGDFAPCNLAEAARGVAPTHRRGKLSAHGAVDCLIANTETSTNSTGEVSIFTTKKEPEESDCLIPPCIERRESADIMENIIQQAESNKPTTDMQLVDMSFSELDDSERTVREISYYENLFQSPATNRNCIPELIGSTCSKEDILAERLADLLDTSTNAEDHVRDFSDLLGRDFDALCETYFDLDQPQQLTENDATVENTKVTSIDKDESERALQCIADLAFLGCRGLVTSKLESMVAMKTHRQSFDT